MNRFENLGGTPAKIRYLSSDFQVLQPGNFVICAVTGDKIPLDELKYWNDERQEAYVDADASLKGNQRSAK